MYIHGRLEHEVPIQKVLFFVEQYYGCQMFEGKCGECIKYRSGCKPALYSKEYYLLCEDLERIAEYIEETYTEDKYLIPCY